MSQKHYRNYGYGYNDEVEGQYYDSVLLEYAVIQHDTNIRNQKIINHSIQRDRNGTCCITTKQF